MASLTSASSPRRQELIRDQGFIARSNSARQHGRTRRGLHPSPGCSQASHIAAIPAPIRGSIAVHILGRQQKDCLGERVGRYIEFELPPVLSREVRFEGSVQPPTEISISKKKRGQGGSDGLSGG